MNLWMAPAGLHVERAQVKDADIIVLIRERTQITKQLVEKLPRLKLIAQTGKVGSHIDVETCTRMGIAVAEGVGSPVAPAELTWALIMAAMRRRIQNDTATERREAERQVARIGALRLEQMLGDN